MTTTHGVYVGLDQSYSGFGLSLYNPATNAHRTVLGKFPLDKYTNEAERLVAIRDWLGDRISNPFEVAMEGYAPGRKFGREMAGELGGQVKVHLWESEGMLPLIVTPTQLKKYVTGSGGAGKNLMILGVYKRWGVEFDNDNLADAYALARVAHDVDRFRTGDTDIPKFQLEIIRALAIPTN